MRISLVVNILENLYCSGIGYLVGRAQGSRLLCPYTDFNFFLRNKHAAESCRYGFLILQDHLGLRAGFTHFPFRGLPPSTRPRNRDLLKTSDSIRILNSELCSEINPAIRKIDSKRIA